MKNLSVHVLAGLLLAFCMVRVGEASFISSTERVIKIFDVYQQLTKALVELSVKYGIKNPFYDE